ncbi:phosphocholine cytidylyltransferase family protein [Paenibacillus massiliensis]|uniref:phosphocholine cytidylyltransferase family protein n=1 Tax=Paenibacillus massiliensis TaxID=225917 RepID=UPI000381F43A|nr:phosphocholine cytidylyltransferase family protein [Paenibacillus massiliensis]
MKLVILAAGIGSRLGEGIPKALVEIQASRTILDQQIENFRDIVGINNITVVVGFEKEKIMKLYPEVSYVYNENYLKTNTSKSLLLALENIRDEDVIFVNGDTYFSKRTAQDISKCTRTSVMVNVESTSDEEVKYRLDDEGKICELSKEVIDAQGEAVGINFIKSEDLSSVKRELAAVAEMDYFEKAFENLIIKKEISVFPLSINNEFVKEIDFPEDLQKVRDFLETYRS